jgi:hypothetical protein
MRSIKAKSRHLGKSSANFRPCTSYQAENERDAPLRKSAANTPLVRRSHTEETLEVCGKSSCLTNELIRNPSSNFCHFKNATSAGFFSSHKPNRDENVFKLMEGKEGR